jgi:hypothetical protein
MRFLTFTLGVKEMDKRNRHNRIKISSLLFLKWRKLVRDEWARASEIACVAGTTPASMYVLLSRWTTWNLVDRLGSYPYRYRITKTGLRYLNNLSKWCPLDTTVIALDVATAASVTLWWGNLWGAQGYRSLWYIAAPFGPDDFHEIDLGGKIVPGLRARGRLLLKVDGPLQAINLAQQSFGLQDTRPIGQSMVDAGLLRWKQ